ncbi:MAG: rhodanese-like domain-containing protein [Saprospiraceae bacterium]|nr:rhodanese-like domain-containing protein [Saprospiraceae bacterium]
MEDKSCKTPRWRMFKARLNNLKPIEAQQLMDESADLILIDVRTPKEFLNGHFEAARNIDYFGDDFYEQMEALDPNQRYLVYCRSGRRSIRACTLMINGGMSKENVFNLDGGWQAWHEVFQFN